MPSTKKKRLFEDVMTFPQEEEQEKDLLDTFLDNLDGLLDGIMLFATDAVLTKSAISKTQKKHRRERRSNNRNTKNTTSSSSMRKKHKDNPSSSPSSDENEQEGILMIVQQPSFDVLANCTNPFVCPLNTIFEAEEEKTDDGIFNNYVVEPLRSVQDIIQPADNDCINKVQEEEKEEDPLIGSTVHCNGRLEEDEEKSLSNRRRRLKILKEKLQEAREENENLEQEINQKDVYLLEYELQEVRKMNQKLREAIFREINRF